MEVEYTNAVSKWSWWY